MCKVTGGHSNPITTRNLCTCDETADSYTINNFCTFKGVGGDNDVNNVCAGISDGEWSVGNKSAGCHFITGEAPKENVDSCFTLPGRRAICQRDNYASMRDNNPQEVVTCCLRDYDFANRFSTRPCLTNAHLISGTTTTANDDSLCFSTSNRTRTCHPKHRSMVSSECQAALFDFCVGTGVDFSEWNLRWCSTDTPLPTCVQIILRNLVGDPEPYYNYFSESECHSGSYTPKTVGVIPAEAYNNRDGFLWSTKVMSAVYERFKNEGFDLASKPGDAKYHPMQHVLFTLFKLSPGISEEVLINFCSSKTLKDLTSDENLLQYCGCYLPDSEYGNYLTNYGIDKQCTPSCSRLDVIHLSKPDGVSKLNCVQSVCVIDDVTIDFINSSSSDISFANICGGCNTSLGESSCVCYTLDTTIEVQNSKIGSINLVQSCSGENKCFKTIDGVSTEVDCTTGVPVIPPAPPNESLNFFDSIPRWVFILFGVLFLIVVLLILI